MIRRQLSPSLWQFGAGAPTLVLAPFGGGSAYSLSDWVPELDRTAIAVQYPGRGPRMAEPHATRLITLAEHVTEELSHHTSGPLVLIGHSMGGVLCHEITRLLEAENRPVELLVVSAARPPRLNRLVHDRVLAMDRNEWIAELDLNGFGVPELMSNPDALDLIIPIMRADYLMLARHNQSSGPVRAPLLAVGGESDPWVRPEHLRAWGELTTDAFGWAQLPGGHFYYRDDLPAFGRLIRQAITDGPRRTAHV